MSTCVVCLLLFFLNSLSTALVRGLSVPSLIFVGISLSRYKVVWVCPLSDKKFREPVFVRKHILNKHMDKVEAAKKDNVSVLIANRRLAAAHEMRIFSTSSFLSFF